MATQVESLTAENTSLRSEIGRLTVSSKKLRLENSALMVMNLLLRLYALTFYARFEAQHFTLPFSVGTACYFSQVKLKDPEVPAPAEPSPKAAASSPSPRPTAENFLSMIDGTTSAPGASRHTEHGKPKLQQLLDSNPSTDVAAVS